MEPTQLITGPGERLRRTDEKKSIQQGADKEVLGQVGAEKFPAEVRIHR